MCYMFPFVNLNVYLAALSLTFILNLENTDSGNNHSFLNSNCAIASCIVLTFAGSIALAISVLYLAISESIELIAAIASFCVKPDFLLANLTIALRISFCHSCYLSCASLIAASPAVPPSPIAPASVGLSDDIMASPA